METVRDFEDLLALFALIAIKSRIDHPRHREDVRVLELVRKRKRRGQ